MRGGRGKHSDVRSKYKFQGFAALIYCQQRQDGIAQNPAEVWVCVVKDGGGGGCGGGAGGAGRTWSA